MNNGHQTAAFRQFLMDWFCCKRWSKDASSYTSMKDQGSAQFHSKYECFELLGEGKTGKVFRVRARFVPHEHGAAKVVSKDYLNTPQRQHAFREELKVLQQVRHPNILTLYDVFEDETQFIIVTECAQGGELMNVLCHPDTQLNERIVAHIIYQLVSVVEYLHSRGITHRDIKLENILCRTSSIQDGIVLIDFGLSHIGRPGVMDMTGMNGTCHYMAPEMFPRNGRYGCEIDLWAIGVVSYVLLFGRFPFDGRFMSQIEDKITAGEYVIPTELMDAISPQAIRFVERLLVVNRSMRFTAKAMLEHPWLQEIDQHVPSRPFSDAHMQSHLDLHQSRQPPSQPQLSQKETSTSLNLFI